LFRKYLEKYARFALKTEARYDLHWHVLNLCVVGISINTYYMLKNREDLRKKLNYGCPECMRYFYWLHGRFNKLSPLRLEDKRAWTSEEDNQQPE